MAHRIEFILDPALKNYDIPTPTPASRVMPDWFKDMGTEVGEGKNGCPVYQGDGALPVRTVKSCVPFLDGLMSGYIILLATDVFVEAATETDGPKFHWGSFPVMDTHNIQQVPGMPVACHYFQGKWLNPWIIKTPPGYGCLFKHPEGRTWEYPFRQHMAWVDTDTYHNQVNGTFDWLDDSWTGTIPAGTPIMHVIPYKRDEWVMKSRVATQKDVDVQDGVLFKLKRRILDRYKQEFWSGPKRFK